MSDQPADIPGFQCMGFSGTSSDAAGYRRGCKSRGEHAAYIRGTQGPGRARHVRTYTVTTRRMSDGAEMSETIGPAYRSKSRWQRRRAEAHLRLVRKLKRTA